MLGRNELEYFGVVPGPLQQGGAQRVDDKLRLPLTQDAVLERFGENRRRPELRTQLFVTTRRDQDQCRACLHALGDGIVGRRVARVQRDEHIGVVERSSRNRAGFELKSVKPALTRRAMTQIDQLGSRFDSAYRRLSPAGLAQEIISGERQIPLAAAHIDEGKGTCRKHPAGSGLRRRDGVGTLAACPAKKGAEDFDKWVDLTELRLPR